MAAETFRIDIPISVKDNTDPGVSSASKKVSAFDRVVEKMQSRVDKATKTKWKVTIEAVDKVTKVISTIGSGIKSVAGKVWSVTMSVVDKVTTPIKKMISVVGDLLGISTAVSTVLAGLSVKNALTSAAESSRMMTQLNVSASNMGISDSGVQQIVNKATNMQQTTMYSDDAMIGSAAELATYFSDTDAITRMMDVVADYAAGMSGGTELSTQEIVDYTTNLAKMTTGAYDAMTKKGFEVTDAQKKILETGTDMEKVAAIEEIIEENWAGMAEAMSSTPTGWLSRLKNAWDDVSKTIGNKLTPGVTSFLSMLTSKMPSVSTLIEDVADKAGSWLEDIVPSLESWIDSAITWVTNLKNKVAEVFSSEEFKNADFLGKISIAWNKIIAEPFSEWWDSTGRAWFADKASSIGEAIGSGLTKGLLALLGIDLSKTVEEGQSVGGAFIQGFKKGFDTEKIGEALKEWANNNKEIVIAIGAIIGFNLITGIAKKLNGLTSLFKNRDSKGSNNPGSLLNSTRNMTVTSSSTTVNGTVVNVYGGKVNDLSSNGNSGSGLPSLGSGGSWLGVPMLGSGGSWLGKLIGRSGGSGLGGLLGSGSSGGGLLLGSGGTAAGSGAAGAGLSGAASAGIVGGILLNVGALIYSFFRGKGLIESAQEAYDRGDTKEAKNYEMNALTRAGIQFSPLGLLSGPLFGAVTGELLGELLGNLLSDWTDEGGWLNGVGKAIGTFFSQTLPTFFSNAWKGISGFFTETIPEFISNVGEGISTFFTETVPGFFSKLWDGVYEFFAHDVPFAIGYAIGEVEVFFTQTLPGFFSDIWSGISTFFTDTLPSWISTIWEGISTFFTVTIPQFFSDVWNGISTFFTDTLPTFVSNAWNEILTFFTETVPNWFSSLWSDICTFFTDTLPSFVTDAWNNITNFFTVTVPGWFSSLWSGICSFVTETIPSWISAVGSVISGWGEAIAGWFSSVWSGIQGFLSSAANSLYEGYALATGRAHRSSSGEVHGGGGGKFAWGGILSGPRYGVVAEDGPEAIIPLSPSKNDRALDLWMKAGQYLGVKPYADGDIVGEPNPVSIQTIPALDGDESGQKVQIVITINPEFIIQAAGADEESIMAIIRSQLREIADEMGGEIAEQIEEIFKNIPVKGGA